MPNEYKLTSFIKVFEKVYHTIDLRAALIKDADQWQVVSMIVRIKLASADIIKQAYQQEVKARQVDSEKFKIIQKCLPFGELDRLMKGISNGLIELESLHMAFQPLKEITEVSGYLSSIEYSENKLSILDWPTLQSSRALRSENPYFGKLQKDAEILRDIELAGFQNVDAAIKQCLRNDYTSSSINLAIHVDVPVRVDQIEASKNEDDAVSFRIYVTAHDALSDIMCNVFTWKSSAEKKFLRSLYLQKSVLDNNLQSWTGVFDAKGTLDLNERIEFQLLYHTLGYLTSEDYHLNRLFKIEVRNPLYTALSLFCPEDEMTNLLIKPKGKTITDIKSGKLYELSMQWLLGCLGFRTVLLHKFEKLKINDHEYGTVDALAYHDRKGILLLVNFTLGKPNNKEIETYKEVQEYFRENVFHNTPIHVYSLVFTDTAPPPMLHNNIPLDDVRICYKNDIKKMIELVKDGYENRFVDFILNPFFAIL